MKGFVLHRVLRRVLAVWGLGLALVAGSVPAWADQLDTRLDGLFDDLKQTENFFEIQSLQAKISNLWEETDSATISLLMERGEKAMASQDYERALAHLTHVTELAPDYAAGWHLRARLLRRLDRYAEAVLNIERAVRLEPRHYLAWMTLGDIFLQLDNKVGAYKAFQKALEINPHLEDAKSAVDYLRPEVEGRGI